MISDLRRRECQWTENTIKYEKDLFPEISFVRTLSSLLDLNGYYTQ